MRRRTISGRMTGPFSFFDISQAIWPYRFHSTPFLRSRASAESSTASAPNESCRARRWFTVPSTAEVGGVEFEAGAAGLAACAETDAELRTNSASTCAGLKRLTQDKVRFPRSLLAIDDIRDLYPETIGAGGRTG